MKRPTTASVSCPVCWGKGKWPAISDSHWHKYGGTRGCDYIRSCPFCCGTGEVKATRAPAKSGVEVGATKRQGNPAPDTQS